MYAVSQSFLFSFFFSFFQFQNAADYHTKSLNHSLVLAGAALLRVASNRTPCEGRTASHERTLLCCALTQYQKLNSPFHFHVNTQIEADTLYLVRINPGNQGPGIFHHNISHVPVVRCQSSK